MKRPCRKKKKLQKRSRPLKPLSTPEEIERDIALAGDCVRSLVKVWRKHFGQP